LVGLMHGLLLQGLAGAAGDRHSAGGWRRRLGIMARRPSDRSCALQSRPAGARPRPERFAPTGGPGWMHWAYRWRIRCWLPQASGPTRSLHRSLIAGSRFMDGFAQMWKTGRSCAYVFPARRAFPSGSATPMPLRLKQHGDKCILLAVVVRLAVSNGTGVQGPVRAPFFGAHHERCRCACRLAVRRKPPRRPRRLARGRR
jgi:hypothetical protein